VSGVSALLAATGLAVGYDADPVLDGLTFAVHAGERVAVLGPNGGGKSTLFRVLTGELAPLAGSIAIAGRVAVVPQTERSRLDYPVTALDVALMGAIPHRAWWRRPGRADRVAAREALAAVGLADLAGRPFGELSGGQRQRVLVARALVHDGEIMLLDEPFAGVDAPSGEVLEGLIDRLAAAGRAVLIATHDIEQARRFDRVLCLNRRQIAFGGPAVLDRLVIEATYGAEIVAVPGEDGAGTRAILPAHHHDHGDGHGHAHG
jgi:ABC-type Mn2+/Zn2+ transport system ATPase subunit